MAYGSLPSRWNRSVSNPARQPPLIDADGSDFNLASLDRRQSLDSVIPLRAPAEVAKRHHGLPSIKALRDKFQFFATGGRKSGQGHGAGTHDGSIKGGDSPKKLVKRTTSARTNSDAKGSDLRERRNETSFVKSASMPSINSLQARDSSGPPPLPLHGLPASVDAILANSAAQSVSKAHPRSSTAPSSSAIHSPPTSTFSPTARRPQTLENLSPTSQPLPVFNRISSDFARPALAPSLSALRAQQLRETEQLNSSLAPTNRHSRILPGATLPSLFPTTDSDRSPSSLSRSQSARAFGTADTRHERTASSDEKSIRPPSFELSSRKRSSQLSTGSGLDSNRLRDDLAYRRHSLSPVVPSATNSSPDGSPTRQNEESPEGQRGKTLSGILGGAARRTSSGLGFGSSVNTGGGGAIEKRRPSKPFPGGFVEVPFQSTTPKDASPVPSARRTLKAISIAPRKTGSSPGMTRTPELVQFPTMSAKAAPSVAVPSPPLVPTRRRQSSAGSELGPTSRHGDAAVDGPRGLRKSSSAGELQAATSQRPRSSDSHVPTPQEGIWKTAGQGSVGSYAARLAELRLLRTPVLDGEDKRASRLETVDSPKDDQRTHKDTAMIVSRRPTEDEEEGGGEESRPASPTHSTTNSPSADHPFRLSTYLDFLPLAEPSGFGQVSSPSVGAALARGSPSPIVPKEVTPAEPGRQGRDDANLTLAQMQHEITKMEQELALAGTPRSFFTEEGDYDSVSLSPETARTLGISTIASPLPGSGSSSVADHVVTPRTARKWSLVEVEKAYERMKRLLGSSSSSRMYSTSDAGADNQSAPGAEIAVNRRPDSPHLLDPKEADSAEDVFSPVRSERQDPPPASDGQGAEGTSPSVDLKLKPLPVLPPPSPSSSKSTIRATPPPLALIPVNDDLNRGDSDRENVESPKGGSSHRRLVLPSRVRSKTSIDEFPTRSEDRNDAAIRRPHSIEPLSPSRSGGRRSRLEGAGPLRSGVGREIQRRALGEFSPEPETPPTSPIRPASRDNVHRVVSPVDGARRRGGARVSESSTWYPVTPRRTIGRTRSSTVESILSEQKRSSQLPSEYDSESTSASTARPELMEVRSLDKLQIFFKYTAVKADLAKTEIERDALLDALRETRETLAEVRKQRDAYEAELKQEKLFSVEIKRHLGSDHDIYIDRLENLVASRAAWQARAEEALEELKKSKLEVTRLEKERSTIGIAPSSNATSPLAVAATSQATPPGSPTLTVPQDHAEPAENRLASSLLTSTTRQRRTISTHSTASSAIGFEGLGNLEVGSPLLSQTMQFPSKSSNSSFSSPTKSRRGPAFAPLASRIPFQVVRKVDDADSEPPFATHASEEEEEDRSFDSTSSVPNTDTEPVFRGLNERDDAFLNELTHEIPKETLEEQHKNLAHLLS